MENHSTPASPKHAGQSRERAPDKNKAYQKPPNKERSTPVEIKLHTQQRAVKRAGFNYLVECKMTMIEHQRQQEERFRKLMEEEEIRMLRKEMIPRAQLMPLFDRPFFPQRSTRPLTIPRDPSFHSKMYSKSWRCMSSCDSYNFQKLTHQSSKPIK
ncbi:TPX2 (targeting protein for Xklp2) protein family [Thalictrum thalictroides]|uniref:TPX2 (Targeting protein for Xklp2) protein family n=1 Tax=Thalictrum thalictroides TaxID=46969 RepID=A0A7J6VVB2_THATH|nr:TPX2 (targeting protein for Xklp2) protein family [Thalictrum thalictroides]